MVFGGHLQSLGKETARRRISSVRLALVVVVVAEESQAATSPCYCVILILLTSTFCVSCGRGSSSASRVIPWTPVGTYNLTTTASSGGLSHNSIFDVVVQ
jgi:hypothetical protein